VNKIFFSHHHFRRKDKLCLFQFKLNQLGIGWVVFQNKNAQGFGMIYSPARVDIRIIVRNHAYFGEYLKCELQKERSLPIT